MRCRKPLLAAVVLVLGLGMAWASGQSGAAPVTPASAAGKGTELPQIWTTPALYEKATGQKVGAWKQSPYLDKDVAAGKIPALKDRLPEEPLVVLGCEGLGKYGGMFIMPARTSADVLMAEEQAKLTMERHTFQDTYPNLLKGFDQIDKEGKVWELKLRKGARWSDGVPFTADDILFYINDVGRDTTKLVRASPVADLVPAVAEKIDDLTVRVTFPTPKLKLAVSQLLSYYGSKFPAHYLKQFHPKYIGEEQYRKNMQAAKFEKPDEYWNYVYDRFNQHSPQKPIMDAWVRATFDESGTVVFKRNPYYFAVDTAGNQLPYFDEYHFVITGTTDVSLLRAMNGDVSWFTTSMGNYSVAKQAEKNGKCRVLPWASSSMNIADIEFNLTHDDPVLRALFKDIRFKMGVSHALNRPQYNELFFNGLSEPWQVAPTETDPFYNERAAHVALEYDPKKADAYLNQAGLDKKDANGWRLRPDGKLLEITLLLGALNWPNEQAMVEMIVDDMKKVGLKVELKSMEFMSAYQIALASKEDAFLLGNSWGTNNGAFGLWDQNMFQLGLWMNFYAVKWNDWWTSKGAKGEKPDQVMLDVMDLVAKSKATINIEEQKGYWKKILDVYADNLWGIGTLKHPGDILIVAPYMRNVPNTKLAIGRGDYGRWDVMYSSQQ
jgi:peptide/nickel transport system substrate-binding protein